MTTVPTYERDPNQRDALEDFGARDLTFLGETRRAAYAEALGERFVGREALDEILGFFRARLIGEPAP